MPEIVFHFVINEDGCFNTVGRAITKDNYPRCDLDGKRVSIARYIYSKIYGPIPEKKIVRHKCDNPLCINPAHLKLGTIKDNMRDRQKRNRTARGEKNGRAKLTKKDIDLIRKHKILTNTELGKHFGVDASTIRDIRNGKIWKKRG